jgi:hypothetical protein
MPRAEAPEVQDLKMLADASGRAGNAAGAAQLYHKIGVILDNAEKSQQRAVWEGRCGS